MAKKKRSVLKRQRQEKKRREYNRNIKNALKKIIKDVKRAVLDQKPELPELLKQAYRMIDKASTKGVIHKNTAARKKSRLAHFVNKYSQQLGITSGNK